MILQDYQKEHLSIEIRQKIHELETLEFIDNKLNIILIGNPGRQNGTEHRMGNRSMSAGQESIVCEHTDPFDRTERSNESKSNNDVQKKI
ncbi:hypothetical protein EDX97_02245 [Absicoccus porci]|uniref:Uncharacterized protein n=1 Tax=Absicoccus porci TaxID=2486576 RepID=A0A3N0I4F8_9FIRM|nr:hypothetical protein EDX97_02245 [Absicoccus porci]